ncbi:Uncharacterized protein Rs2_02380 [Raphanus sativus]|nr:Uncharacterized protein Rs2_02380 [Raphanus sativus]
MEKENEVNVAPENEWTTVSPGKVGRSAEKKGKDVEHGQDSILSNSRFSVLSLDEEDGEIIERVEEAEKGDLKELEKVAETQASLSEDLKNTGVEEIHEKEIQNTISQEGDEIVGLIKNREANETTMETPEEGASQKAFSSSEL